jgi:hypothetical protein
MRKQHYKKINGGYDDEKWKSTATMFLRGERGRITKVSTERGANNTCFQF